MKAVRFTAPGAPLEITSLARPRPVRFGRQHHRRAHADGVHAHHAGPRDRGRGRGGRRRRRPAGRRRGSCLRQPDGRLPGLPLLRGRGGQLLLAAQDPRHPAGRGLGEVSTRRRWLNAPSTSNAFHSTDGARAPPAGSSLTRAASCPRSVPASVFGAGSRSVGLGGRHGIQAAFAGAASVSSLPFAASITPPARRTRRAGSART